MARVSRSVLAAHLRALADRVESGDSAEGSFEYSIPPDDYETDDVEFVCSYRYGNLSGQGCVRIVGPTKEK